MANTQERHWNAVIHILRYLKDTLDFGIVHSKNPHAAYSPIGFTHSQPITQFEGFTDADWAACKDSCRSTGGSLSHRQGAPPLRPARNNPPLLYQLLKQNIEPCGRSKRGYSSPKRIIICALLPHLLKLIFISTAITLELLNLQKTQSFMPDQST